MADPERKDVEDVLSSIRRLVSEEAKATEITRKIKRSFVCEEAATDTAKAEGEAVADTSDAPPDPPLIPESVAAQDANVAASIAKALAGPEDDNTQSEEIMVDAEKNDLTAEVEAPKRSQRPVMDKLLLTPSLRVDTETPARPDTSDLEERIQSVEKMVQDDRDTVLDTPVFKAAADTPMKQAIAEYERSTTEPDTGSDDTPVAEDDQNADIEASILPEDTMVEDTSEIAETPEIDTPVDAEDDLSFITEQVEAMVQDVAEEEVADAVESAFEDIPDTSTPDNLSEEVQTPFTSFMPSDDLAEDAPEDVAEDVAEDVVEDTAEIAPEPETPEVDFTTFDQEAALEDDEPPSARNIPIDIMDEEILEDIVARMVRKELQGELGDRITRNVRKLVRREIHRALVTRDLG